MRVVNVEHRDIHVTMDFSLNEIAMLRDALSVANINYNSEENPELVKAVQFLTNGFYPILDKLVQTSGGSE